MDHREQTEQTPPRRAYRRTTPHVTVEPIQDDPTRYVTRERYTTLEDAPRRRHMGTATSDPEYLPRTEPGARRATAPEGAPHASLHYDRYLQTPKPGRSIFTSRHDRARRRTRLLLIALLVAVIVALVAWFLFLR